ncbi:GFA family protein [Pseudomonas gingeri]|uniref:GFA family protein n=1 Tax=Pseudomonas gingeri TaxID=117681 RepID=UPI0015A2A122|nr:GFA family protein [Pseudomonas gingeri]NVZ99105.1 GFA family protein [Pseudomonas gingeri]NWA13150.1 GFA family protein [Pseudomonas gingeri]NWA55411.1 GFA family protein [Pseudomonas gingeri]NWA95735.1 GFA family protein [Pseudomonas gingeri]NWB00823.1 GFA family protein [Pseudomonas gingeri]
MTHSITTMGSCRCGGVAFELRAQPITTSACHCTGCQKMAASAFSLTALMLAEHFVITRGVPVAGGLRGATQHLFCPDCLTWICTRPEGNDAVIGVRSALLENPENFRPFMETWTSEKLSWAVTGAAHSFERFPEPHEYAALAEKYRQR